MTYEWREHTAEVELHVDAETEADVFREALDAFGRLVELEPAGEHAHHDVQLEAADRGSLLVAWLEELIYLADTDSFIPDRAAELHLYDGGLSARLDGRRADVDPLVKAATYHGLGFTHDEGRWRARVVLDV